MKHEVHQVQRKQIDSHYGMVSLGAATDGVTLYFRSKKLTTFFSHRPLKSDDLFSAVATPSPSPPANVDGSVLSVNLAAKM